MSILDNLFGLWWVAITSALAAAYTLYGAMKGAPQHRMARIMLGVATAAISVSYWWDLTSEAVLGPMEMRRGAGIVWFPALLWTAWSGVKYARRQNEIAQRALDAYRGSSEEGSDG